MMTIKPTVEIRPPWSPSSLFDMYNNLTLEEEDDFDELDDSLVGLDSPSAGLDAYSSCDEFRMYEFKIRRCARGRSHDWTECPYAHPGEKARRRDPRKYHYSGTACPDFRRGNCKRGDGCDMAHGVFECWLHPARYRTQPCKDGTNCTRRVCFFAHTPEQLRVLPQSPKTPVLESYDGSPMRRRRSRVVVVEEEEEEMKVLQMMRRLQLGRVERFGGFCSLPTTTTTSVMSMTPPMSRMGLNEGVEVERVESGRELRLKMYERLSKESGVGRGLVPDVGWVSELVK